eukprot:m.89781 g.89781  ORF g.89781 m.89781 type:complete len:496 (+) comp14984_c0_seq4:73-1560(+)
MHGCVLPSSPVAVDIFTSHPGVRLYFLTHLHADHTVGLTPSWSRGPIYCSALTKAMLLHKFHYEHPELVHVLEVGEATLVPLDEVCNETMTVTVVDANHCPGAVMFLFQAYFGSVLCTGDFRYDPDLHAGLKAKGPFDYLYLDNTYGHPSCIFPPREEARKALLETVGCFVNTHEIIIGMDSLGKESLLVEIANHFGVKIHVTLPRWQLLHIQEQPDVFTLDPDETNVHVLMKHEVTRKRILAENELFPTVGVLTSALFAGDPYADICKDGTASNVDQKLIHRVPYSDHSSFSELVAFVELCRPRKMVPLVSERNLDLDAITYFAKFLDHTPSATFVVPKSVEAFMNPGAAAASCGLTRRLTKKLLGRPGRSAGGGQQQRHPRGVEYCPSPSLSPPTPRTRTRGKDHHSGGCGRAEDALVYRGKRRWTITPDTSLAPSATSRNPTAVVCKDKPGAVRRLGPFASSPRRNTCDVTAFAPSLQLLQPSGALKPWPKA